MKPLRYLIGSAILSAYLALGTGVANAEEPQKEFGKDYISHPKDQNPKITNLSAYIKVVDGKGKNGKKDNSITLDEHMQDFEDYMKYGCDRKIGWFANKEMQEGACRAYRGIPRTEKPKTDNPEDVAEWFTKNYSGDQDKAYMNQILGKDRFELLDINHDGVIDAKDDLNGDNQIDDEDRELFKKQKDKK